MPTHLTHPTTKPVHELPSARHAALAAALAPVSETEIDDALRTLMHTCDVLPHDIADPPRRVPELARQPTSPNGSTT